MYFVADYPLAGERSQEIMLEWHWSDVLARCEVTFPHSACRVRKSKREVYPTIWQVLGEVNEVCA
jgi:hypothetical protein